MRLVVVAAGCAFASAVCFTAPAHAVTCPAANGDAYSSAVLADAPAEYYRLNEPSGVDMCDSSASANHGTYSGAGMSYGVPGALMGDPDTAVSGDGSNGALIGSSNANSGITGDSSFSFEAWVKTAGGAQNQSLVAIGASGNGHIAGMTTWNAVCSPAGSVLGLDEFAGSDCWDTTSVANLFDGQFHYLVVTYDATAHVVTGYVDAHGLGSHAVSTTGGVFNLSASPVRVGNWIDAVVNKSFRGVLDEVAVYSTALSSARVAAHYAAGSSKRLSATQVICNRGADPTSNATCTATVGDASTGLPKITPTGTVTFTATQGGFPQGATCDLVQTPNSIGVASCGVTYANSAGIPAGTVLPITATYSGDANFVTSNGSPQLGGVPDLPPTAPPAEQPGATDCPQAALPAVRVTGAPPVSNPYCSYRAKYTANEKKDAEQWRRYYSDLSIQSSESAGVMGLAAVAASEAPPVATVYGLIAGGVGLVSVEQGKTAEQMARVVTDPPDPRWKTIAAPPRTFPKRIQTPRGIRAADAKAFKAYLGAVARATALAICGSQSIDRSATAFSNSQPLIAARQYRAGAKCAAEAATLAKRMPTLARGASRVVAAAEARLRRTKVPAKPSAALRARVAARTVTAVARLIALTPGEKAALKRSLTAAMKTAKLPKGGLAAQLRKTSAQDAKWAAFSKTSSGVLAAAAATQGL